MKTISLSEAQKRLPELMQLVALGEEFEITDNDQRIAHLVSEMTSARRVDWCECWTKAPGNREAALAGDAR